MPSARQIQIPGGLLCCERCRARHFIVERRGFSLLKAGAGYVLHGLAGTALGFSGANDTVIECARCHAKWLVRT